MAILSDNGLEGTRFASRYRLIPREGKKCLCNDTLNTFYLRIHGVGHIVKDHSTSPYGAVAMSSANGLEGTRFTSRYRLIPSVFLKAQ